MFFFVENGMRGRVGKPAYLEDWITTITPLTAGDSAFEVNFDWDEKIGVPGAFIIRNEHRFEFYLKTLTLHNVPDHGRLHFVCNSWVYPTDKYKTDRIFFANKVLIYEIKNRISFQRTKTSSCAKLSKDVCL